MTREEFNTGFATLLNCFPSDRITPETQEIYWRTLNSIPADRWNEGIEECLAIRKFFPLVSELASACYGSEHGWLEYRRKVKARELKQIEYRPDLNEQRKRLRELTDGIGRA